MFPLPQHNSTTIILKYKNKEQSYMGKDLFKKVFPIEKPIIGMIHLTGANRNDKVKTALKEILIYGFSGVDGAIIENYHGNYGDVLETLRNLDKIETNLTLGLNTLGRPIKNPLEAFDLANQYDLKFLQFDSINDPGINHNKYMKQREKYPNLAVLGGVGFKYAQPTGLSLYEDIESAKQKCDAIVTTGPATGVETPIEKLRHYRRILDDFPLIVGAGVNKDNAYEQLSIADGAIIGSYFKKNGMTSEPLDTTKIGNFTKLFRMRF